MDAKIIQKYRKKTTKNLKNTAKNWFNKFIRLRDCDENGYAFCISSGVPLVYGTENCQAGHFYAAGSYESMRFTEKNVHIQGKSDNYFASANLHEYRKNLIKKIGEDEVKDLDFLSEQDKRLNHKWDRFTLIDIIETYKYKCKELGKSKNFKI